MPMEPAEITTEPQEFGPPGVNVPAADAEERSPLESAKDLERTLEADTTPIPTPEIGSGERTPIRGAEGGLETATADAPEPGVIDLDQPGDQDDGATSATSTASTSTTNKQTKKKRKKKEDQPPDEEAPRPAHSRPMRDRKTLKPPDYYGFG
ncbi:MAG: hypothetical protein GY819_18955, partial [Planctomycetaceae bacterium]|nr:hypothetical protein [Planctomycetaceae bacterium]